MKAPVINPLTAPNSIPKEVCTLFLKRKGKKKYSEPKSMMIPRKNLKSGS